MKRGRPNIYVSIVKKLGGRATVQEIYDYGIEHELIRCEFSGCVAALQVNLRKKNLYGSVHKTIYLTFERMRANREQSPVVINWGD